MFFREKKIQQNIPSFKKMLPFEEKKMFKKKTSIQHNWQANF
jgi:hypothetical protein